MFFIQQNLILKQFQIYFWQFLLTGSHFKLIKCPQIIDNGFLHGNSFIYFDFESYECGYLSKFSVSFYQLFFI